MPTTNNFDHLSDSDLDDMVRAVSSKGNQPTTSLTAMSDDDLDKMVLAKAKSPQASFLDKTVPFVGGTPRGYIQGALDFAPTAGAMIGGGLGAVGGGAAGTIVEPGGGTILGGYEGAVGGAAAGGALGEGARQLGQQYILGKPAPSRKDYYTDVAGGAAKGVLQEAMAVPFGMAGKSFAGAGVNEIAPTLARPGAKEITSAAGALGVKPTQGMLTNDYTVRNLEDSLGQSPSIPGALIRREQAPVRDAIRGAAENSVSGQSMQSDYDAGRALKKGISENFEKRLEPISKDYSDIENQTKDIPLNEKGLKRIATNIRNLDDAKFSGSDGHKVANQFATWLEDAENVNDIKTLKTKARYITEDPNASRESKMVASSIMDKLEQARNNSVTRQAVQVARETPIFPPEGKSFPSKTAASDAISMAEDDAVDKGKGLINKIKSTNANYRGLMQDAKTFGEGTGLSKGKAGKGMSATLQDIQDATPEEVSKAVFDPNNVDFLKFMQEKMPDQFELARQQKLAEVVKKTGGDPNKIIKLTEKMGPEAREILFGKKNVENLSNAGTLLKSIPGKVGASDTPRGLAFRDLGLVQNAEDIARYGLLKGKRLTPGIGGLIEKSARPGAGMLRKGLVND